MSTSMDADAPEPIDASLGEATRGERKARLYPIGAEVQEGGVHFRVWAPKSRAGVSVVLEGHADSGREQLHAQVALQPDEAGYFSGFVAGAAAGTRYRFRLHGEKGGALHPDPASRSQPQGPDAPSEVLDWRAYQWRDQHWRGVQQHGLVLYELHVGTFTHEGTLAAAAERLPALAALGITCIQVHCTAYDEIYQTNL